MCIALPNVCSVLMWLVPYQAVHGVWPRVDMQPEFPPHLDPNTFKITDFEDPYDAFYWFGYFSRHCTETAVSTDTDKRATTSPPRGVPLRGLAEFCTFDTETSGLSATDCAVQVAIGFFRSDGSAMGCELLTRTHSNPAIPTHSCTLHNTRRFYNKLWKLPSGTVLSRASVRVHKITAAKLEAEGSDALPELHVVHRIFSTMRRRGKKIVAHNASFDARILKQTAERHGFQEWDFKADDFFCTMRSAKYKCQLMSAKNNRIKAPTNAELYKFLTGLTADGPLHDACYDTQCTATSFKFGCDRGWWSM